MSGVTEFVVDECYTNDQIRFALALENLGGIRPSVDEKRHLRHLAVLTAAHDSRKLIAENPYVDRIEGDVLVYTAQGREGDQELKGRNRRLLDQYTVPAPYFGFMNLGRQTYRFLGLLELLRHFQETQADRKGDLRRVWVFEFRIHTDPPVVPLEQAREITAVILSESRSRTVDVILDREVEDLNVEPEAPTTSDEVLTTEYVRSRLFLVEPYRFEGLIRDLMLTSGFSQVDVTRQSGDGGIDIDAYVGASLPFFEGSHVQVQVKRWRHSVGSVEVNSFRGALSTSAHGVFVTTSHFTRAATAEAGHTAKPRITLIDGGRLSGLLLHYGVSVDHYV